MIWIHLAGNQQIRLNLFEANQDDRIPKTADKQKESGSVFQPKQSALEERRWLKLHLLVRTGYIS